MSIQGERMRTPTWAHDHARRCWGSRSLTPTYGGAIRSGELDHEAKLQVRINVALGCSPNARR
jgi:hypothetical protein